MVHLLFENLSVFTPQQEQEAKERWANTIFTGVCESPFECLSCMKLIDTTRSAGVWAQYLAKKVKKVFPDLELPDFEHNSKPSTRFTVAVET